MNEHELTKLLGELQKTRTLSLIERAAISEAIGDMTFTDAIRLCVRLFGEHAHVNAATINQDRGRAGQGAALAAWDYVCDHILEGPHAELYWRQRQPVPPGCFEDPIAYEAFRKTGKFIRTESADYARRKYLAAYKAASRPAGPALGAGVGMQALENQ